LIVDTCYFSWIVACLTYSQTTRAPLTWTLSERTTPVCGISIQSSISYIKKERYCIEKGLLLKTKTTFNEKKYKPVSNALECLLSHFQGQAQFSFQNCIFPD